MLPVVNKVIEKVISARLINFLEANKLLSNCQHGFRKNRSTESALLNFTSNVYKCLEEKLNVIGIFLDLSKAFDSLLHNILLDKLKNMGIRGIPLQLFTSYLENRKQIVFCNEIDSEMRNIYKGVPHGSVLGPILFLIYINDIIQSSSSFQYVLFADDTNILLADKDINSLHSTLTIELPRIVKWVNDNKLKLNTSKTNYILFQNHSVNNVMPPLILNG